MYLWNGSSSHFVSTSPSSHTTTGTAVISGYGYHTTGDYSLVTYDCYHQGFEDLLGEGNWYEDGANNTSTSCSLPSSKSSILDIEIYYSKDEVYKQVKHNYSTNISELDSLLDLSEYYYCHMLDWANISEIVTPLKDKPNAINDFSRLVMEDVHNKFIKDGDSAPAFWFSKDGYKAYIGFTKENRNFVLLSTELLETYNKGQVKYS